MMKAAWKSRAASCIAWSIAPDRNIVPRLSTVRW